MIKKLISSFFARSLVAFASLAIMLVQSRQLGSETFGYVSLFVLNFAIVQAISDIYTGPALVYFIPRYSLTQIYRTGLVWTVGCILVVNLVFYIFNIGVTTLWMHVLFLSLIATLHAFHTVILLAKEKIRIYNVLIFLQPLVLFAVLCLNIFVFGIRNVNAYIIAAYSAWSLSLLISGLCVIKCIRSHQQTANISLKAILQNGLVNQLGNLAHTLSNRYNYYMIPSAAMLGIYASATSLIESVWILSGSISPIILTHIANRSDSQNNSRVTFLLSKICFLLSALCVVVVLILPESFFTFLLGKDFTGTKSLMLNLSPGVLCLSFSSIISHYFSGLGKQRILLAANGCGLIVTLCSSCFFIQRFGLLGACYAASLSYLVQALVIVVVFMKQNQFKLAHFFTFKGELKQLSSESNE